MIFPEILDDNGNYVGFDAIIGNPPYMRVAMIDNSALKDKYKDIYQSVSGKYDLYILFTEKSLSLIKEDGLINFIMPIVWTHSETGEGLRTFISNKKAISKIIDLSTFKIFDATVYIGLQWFKKNSNFLEYFKIDNTSKVDLEKSLEGLSNSSFNKISIASLTEKKWTLSGKNEISILNKLKEQKRSISDIYKIYVGIATNKDDVYFLYDCNYNEQYVVGFSKQLKEKIQIEKELVKPLLKGKDVHRYNFFKKDKYVIFPYKKENDSFILYTEDELKTYFPRGYEYLKQNRKALNERENRKFDLDGKWFQYGRKQGLNHSGVEKI